MTNIPAITTNVAKTAVTTQGNAPGAAAGLFGGVPGMNFMDMIFARQIGTQAATGDTSVLKAPAVVHPSFATNTPALVTQQIATAVDAGEAALITPDMLADGLSMEEINALLAKLTGAQEQSGSPDTITTNSPPVPLSGKQKEDILKVIATLLQGQPNQAALTELDQAMADPSLVATPLTPALLTEIVEKLQTGADAAALIGNLVRIVPPAPAAVTLKSGKTGPDMVAAIASETEEKTENNVINPLLYLALPEGETQPGDDAALAARMNALTPGAADSTDAGLAGLKAAIQPGTPAPIGAGNEYMSNAALNGKPATSAAGGSSFTGTQGTALESLLNSAGWESIYPDGLEWTQQPGGVAHASLNLTGPSSFASLVTQAQTATTPHPATQIVAATLTKAASDGETKSMTLKLDPPELGRLEIRMDFAKEKGMKAHIVVEKHETYMMMQRDAHVLERALQDAGIGAEGGLSFELAQDGGLFDDGHQGGNRHGGGSGGKADGDAEAIIETTMNWSVDANGMTHYDLLV